jgi:hypothetical protein
METDLGTSSRTGLPAWGISLITLVVSIFFLFILASALGSLKFLGDAAEPIAYVCYDILIAIACFMICRREPASVWYVPLICNIPCFIAAVVEPSFWVTSLGILVGGGFVASIGAAVGGSIAGRRAITQPIR